MDTFVTTSFVFGQICGPNTAFGMVRVLLDSSEIRSEMARISNAMTVVLIRLQCAFLSVLQEGFLAKAECFCQEVKTGIVLLSMSCKRAGHNPLADVVWDSACSVWLCVITHCPFLGSGNSSCSGGRVCVCGFWLPFSFHFFSMATSTERGDHVEPTLRHLTKQGRRAARMSKSTSCCGPNLWRLGGCEVGLGRRLTPFFSFFPVKKKEKEKETKNRDPWGQGGVTVRPTMTIRPFFFLNVFLHVFRFPQFLEKNHPSTLQDRSSAGPPYHCSGNNYSY